MADVVGVHSYKDLQVWQKSITLVESVYQQTKAFPKEEIYGLTSQIRRCAVSVPSNIAEGCSRRTSKDFLRFLSIAYGSLSELETQIFIAHRLNFINQETLATIEQKTAEIGKMLNGLRTKLQAKLTTNH